MLYKKSLGQHILHGEGILKKIAGALGDIGNEVIVEIGGGTGNLTGFLVNNIFSSPPQNPQRGFWVKPRARSLSEHPKECSDRTMPARPAECASKTLFNKKLIVYEIDKELAEKLESKFPNAEIRSEDFLNADLKQFKNDYLLIGNIPYSITGKILRKIFELQNYPKIAVLTVSEEQGEKLLGLPHNNFWSNWIKIWGEISKICAIKAGSFFPPPKIDSIAIKISFYKKPLIKNPEDFAKFLKIIFNRPKQTIYNNLKRIYENKEAEEFTELRTLRAHQLTFERILELYKKLCTRIYETIV